MDEIVADRQPALEMEQAIRESQATPKEIGGIPPVRAAAQKKEEVTPVAQAQVEQPKEEISVPKWRFDEINSKYQELKSQPKTVSQTSPPPSEDVERLIEQKLAPIKVQMEVDQVLKKYDDFGDYAPRALEEIKANPNLSLEKAYKLVKFSDLESKAKEAGKTIQTIEKKQALTFEQSGRRVEQKPLEDLVSDKTVPLSEIAKMLPHG